MTDNKLLKMVEHLFRLGLVRCRKPSGRFGEDDCGTCISCRVGKEFYRRRRDRKRATQGIAQDPAKTDIGEQII